MMPDLSRPPVPPRRRARAVLPVLAMFAFSGAAWLVFIVLLGSYVEFWFVWISGTLFLFVALVYRRIARSYKFERSEYDTPDRPRYADLDELRAYRLLRQGRISRNQYERIVARRRFAHGEYSVEEYNAVLRYLDGGATGAQSRSPAT